MTTPPRSTRDRLIDAMTEALRTRGYHGIGLNELLAAAQAPKGVLYHHFPGGKADLAVHAIDAVALRLDADLERLFKRADDPVDALSQWMDGAQKSLQKSGFERGCPLATIALESTSGDDTIRQALTRTFERLRHRISDALQASGCDPSLAPGMATLIVSTYEGALLQSRVSGLATPMREASETLGRLLRLHLAPGKGAESAESDAASEVAEVPEVPEVAEVADAASRPAVKHPDGKVRERRATP